VLIDLIDLPPQPLISIVGAGGKTTTMYTLANELAQRGQRVITTTTTNIYFPRPGETDALIVAAETPRLLKMINAAWKQHRHITVAGTVTGAGKLAGLHVDQPYELLKKSGADAVIVEADGARHLMIKAPAEHEPMVPPQTNVALLMLSAEAINRPLRGDVAHRPERVAEVAGIKQGEILTPDVVARLMTSEQGAMKRVPETARAYVLVTHVMEENEEAVREVISLVEGAARVVGVCCSMRPGDWFGM
jgi:probable selenium-dependent hydroxylase accessory protein YqeC